MVLKYSSQVPVVDEACLMHVPGLQVYRNGSFPSESTSTVNCTGFHSIEVVQEFHSSTMYSAAISI